MTSKVQFRLPVLFITSRESQRLPIESLRQILGCDENLRIEGGSGASEPTNHFLYFIPDECQGGDSEKGCENRRYENRFRLVEVGENFKETLLDEGEISGSRIHFGGVRYTDFSILGDKLGNFKVYCGFAEIGY